MKAGSRGGEGGPSSPDGYQPFQYIPAHTGCRRHAQIKGVRMQTHIYLQGRQKVCGIRPPPPATTTERGQRERETEMRARTAERQIDSCHGIANKRVRERGGRERERDARAHTHACLGIVR